MIRRATPADARAIAALHLRWLAAYGDVLTHQRILARDERVREQTWRDHLEGARATSVLVVNDAIAGFASAGPSRDGDAEAQTGELYALYVDPDRTGAGLGGMLHDDALDRLVAEGFTHATLWTFGFNSGAHAFYVAHGWQRDAACPPKPTAWAPEVRFRRDVG